MARRPSLPAPTGPYQVGTTTASISPRTPDTGTAIAVRAWYPARPGAIGLPATGTQSIQWRRFGFRRDYATAALVDAPITGDGSRLPLVLYVPSWNGDKAEATALAQDIASYGFVVVAMDPPSTPPDRREMDFSSADAGAATLRLAGLLVDAQARDAIHLLDRIVHAGDGEPLADVARRIDPTRIGVIGFSFGGAVAAQACWIDRRFRAALDMDGWLFGEAASNGVSQPFMVMSDDTPLPGEADLRAPDAGRRLVAELNVADDRRMVANMARHGGTRVTIEGARHANFTDAPLTWPIARMVGAGLVTPIEAFRVIATYTVAFLDKSLRGGDPAVLRPDGPPLPGARIERWAAPGPRE